MSQRKFSLKDWNDRHFARVEQYADAVGAVFRKALDEAVRLAIELRINPDELFSFDDYPQATERIEKIIRQLSFDLLLVINSASKAQWLFSNQKNDALVSSVLRSIVLPISVLNRYLNPNDKALTSFLQRVVGGKSLTERVQKIANQFKREIELGIDIGYGNQKSAAQLSRELRADLKEPERLFRRVKNKHGNLVLSKAAEQYHPGAGNYRSSYKNALRVARTTINEAYREADYNRYQQLDFVVGIEIRRSNNPYPCTICEPMKGKYPKTFVFRGWHPNCRCVTIPILVNEAELSKLNELLIAGQPSTGFRSENEITENHPGFTRWLEDNAEKLARMKTLPQFIKDNA